ncbi:MAG: hypothetical protein OHK0019_34930 [Saprospiraceae bacterium]
METSSIIRELIENEEINLVGARYSVETSKVTFLNSGGLDIMDSLFTPSFCQQPKLYKTMTEESATGARNVCEDDSLVGIAKFLSGETIEKRSALPLSSVRMSARR